MKCYWQSHTAAFTASACANVSNVCSWQQSLWHTPDNLRPHSSRAFRHGPYARKRERVRKREKEIAVCTGHPCTRLATFLRPSLCLSVCPFLFILPLIVFSSSREIRWCCCKTKSDSLHSHEESFGRTHPSLHSPLHLSILSFIHLFTSLHLHSFIYPSILSFIHIFTPLPLHSSISPSTLSFIHLFTPLPLHSSIYPSIQSFIHLFVHAGIQCHTSIHVSIHVIIHPSIQSTHPSVRPSFHPYIHQSKHASTHPPVRPSMHPFNYPSIHPSIQSLVTTNAFIRSSVRLFVHPAEQYNRARRTDVGRYVDDM